MPIQAPEHSVPVDAMSEFNLLIAHGSRTALILALIDFSIGIAQLDCDVSLQLVFESDSLHINPTVAAHTWLHKPGVKKTKTNPSNTEAHPGN